MAQDDSSTSALMDGLCALLNDRTLPKQPRGIQALALLDLGVFRLPRRGVTWDGVRHGLARVDANPEVIHDYPRVLGEPERYARVLAKGLMACEANPSLRVPLAAIHEDLHGLLLRQDMTGLTFMLLATRQMLKIRQVAGDYAVLIDSNLVMGLPQVHVLVAELLKSLRRLDGVDGGFAILMVVARNFDALQGRRISRPVVGASSVDGLTTISVRADGYVETNGQD